MDSHIKYGSDIHQQVPLRLIGVAKMYAIILYLSTATKHVEFRVGIKLVKLDSNEENHFLQSSI